jgi:uncharacterized protein YkwD
MATIRRAPAAALVLVAALLLGGCMDEQERAAFDQVNQARAAAGLASLAEDDELVRKAQGWADVLAAEGGLRHSTLSDGLTPGRWGRLAENVGVVGASGDPVATMQRAFSGSSAHRANQLGAYTHAGVGITVAADGRVFQVQVFAAAR